MRLSGLLPSSAMLLALACGSAAPPPTEVGLSRPAAQRKAAPGGVPALDSVVVARVPKGTFGPYVGHDSERALLIWAAEEQGARAWFALPMDREGHPDGEPRRVGTAPSEIGVVAVRSLKDGAFAVVSTRRSATGEQVEVMVLGADGKPRGAPRRVGESPSPVLWVDAARVGARSLVLWASQGAGGADVSAVPITASGEVAGEERKPAAGVRAWQTAVFGEELALAVVRASAERGKSGPVEVLWLGSDAQLSRSPTLLSSEATAELDLDLTAVGDRLVALWSDRRFGEARLMSAAIAPDRSVVVPAAAFTRPLGEQALLRVIASGQRGYAVWENVSAPDGSGRSFEIASFGREARAEGEPLRVLYGSYDGSVPEVAAFSGGLSLLTLAPACALGSTCDRDESLPSFLQLDAKLEAVAFEPVRLRALGGNAPDLGWGLTCLPNACFMLSAQNEAPARIHWAALEGKSDVWLPPISKPADAPAPRVIETEVLASAEPLAALGVASVGGRKLLAWLTDFDPTTPWVRLKAPAPDGRYDPLRSTLAVTTFEPGRAAAPAQSLSLRAHSLAGLALAPGRNPQEAVLGWAGVDAGQPQVFLTRLGEGGAKRDQKMLTRKRGGVSDVGVAAVADGYVVGWLDERSGAPELMTAKVNAALVRVGAEQTLSRRGASPAELVLSATAGGVLAVWSDAGGENRGDLYGLRISPRDGSAAGAELRLSETALHSFSPALCARADRTAIAWLERADVGDDQHALMLGLLDAAGGWQQAPERIPLTQGTPASLGLDCDDGSVRVAIVVEGGERRELVVLEHRAGKAGTPTSVARLASGSRSAVQPVLAGDDVYVAEASPSGGDRVRRLKLVWR